MLKAIVISFLLLYFVYWTWFHDTAVSRPASPAPILAWKKTFTHSFESSQPHSFAFLINGQVQWQETLPKPYIFQNGHIVPRNVCFQIPNGKKVLATGEVLYNYLKSHALTPLSSPLQFDSHASMTFQKGHKFYFTCQAGEITGLEACPPNHIFKKDACRSIDACRGRDGIRISDPFNELSYYQCQGNEEPIRVLCPKDTFFLHDSCRSMKDPSHYCRFFNEPIGLTDTSILHCRNGKPFIETCREGFKVQEGRCQFDVCRNHPDGTRIPLPDEILGLFRYSPGYFECFKGRVIQRQICSKTWDAYDSNGDNLSTLPLVFDGKDCAVPTFCTNVQSDDPDVIIPVYEFSKHVSNWKHALDMDRLAGYVCEGKKRKRVTLDPGQRISKYMKRESACDGTQSKIIVPDQPDRYFDCQTGLVQTCEENTFFDGLKCRQRIPFSHTYKQWDMFQLDSLSQDNWILPWPYAKQQTITPPCQAPESIHLTNYNICSHPDCVQYPFLSQIPFSIALRNEKRCIFRETDRRLVRENTQNHYKFWSQRQVPQSVSIDAEPCTPGQRLKSGHFVMDSTMYATCDYKQPFVFCPSSKTTGIQWIEGTRYACMLDQPREGFLPADTSIELEKNHVKRIKPLFPMMALPKVKMNKDFIPVLLEEGIEVPKNQRVKIIASAPLKLEYNYTVTHPPNVVFQEEGIKITNIKNAFIGSRQDFTQKALDFPSYNIRESVPDFAYGERS